MESKEVWFKVIHDVLPVGQHLFKYHVAKHRGVCFVKMRLSQFNTFLYFVETCMN
jgi:hypothetical protein